MLTKEKHTIWMRQYRRTLRGFLDQKYTAMSKRVRGKDLNCINTVAGLPIVSRPDFIRWAYQQSNLPHLFEAYKQSGWKFKLCPTIDRVNPRSGYTFENMRFITQSENARGSCWNMEDQKKRGYRRGNPGVRRKSWGEAKA